MKRSIRVIQIILLITTFIFWSPLEGMSGENIGHRIVNLWDRMHGQPVATRSGLALQLPPLERQEAESKPQEHLRILSIQRQPSIFNYLRAQELGQSHVARRMRNALESTIERKLTSTMMPLAWIKDRDTSRIKEYLGSISISLNMLEELYIGTGIGRGYRLTSADIDFIARHFPALVSLFVGRCNMHDDGFEALARSSLASRLQTLDIRGNSITSVGFTQDVLNRFTNLKYLEIGFNPIGDIGFDALSKSNVASQLIRLFMSNNNITSSAFTSERLNNFVRLESLSLNSKCIALEELRLGFQPNILTDEGFKALANSTIASRVQVLEIGLSTVTATYFTPALLNRFMSLKELYVWGCELLGEGTLKSLARSIIAPQLIKLDIEGNNIGSQGFNPVWLNKFVKLKVLFAGGNKLGDSGFDAIAESTIASTLTTLTIDNNNIRAYEFAMSGFNLSNLNKFTSLEALNISNNKLGDFGFICLAESKLAPKLATLTIKGIGATKWGLTVARLKKFTNLKDFSFGGNNSIGEVEIEALRRVMLANSQATNSVRE